MKCPRCKKTDLEVDFEEKHKWLGASYKDAEEALKDLEVSLYRAAVALGLPVDLVHTVRGMQKELRGQARRVARHFKEKR